MKPEENDTKSFLIKIDINLEKWNLFALRMQNNERKLQRTNGEGLTQTVYISIFVHNGKKRTLTAAECKLMYVLANLWQNAGCPMDKPVLFSFRQVADELLLKGSGETLSRIKCWLLNLRSVPLIFENCYKTSKNGEILKTTEIMTILHHLNIFERKKRNKGEPYSAFSEFQFHPYILQSLHNNFVKPVRLDVIRQLKNDTAIILYRWLDLMLFKQNVIERELKNLAKELGLEHIRFDNFLKIVRRAAVELVGKELVTGMIGSCEVERLKDDSGWKLIVKKTKRSNEIELETNQLGDDECYKYFNTLDSEVQKQIETKIDQEAEQDSGYKLLHSDRIKKLWKEGKLVELLNQMMVDKKTLVCNS